MKQQQRRDAISLGAFISAVLIVPTASCPADMRFGQAAFQYQPCNADDWEPVVEAASKKRRRLFEYLTTTAAAATFGPQPSSAFDEPNLDCLLDLPPLSEDCVRVYLCRHGQTENNRLHLFQGTRVNAPINERGRAEATRLGMAFGRLGGETTCPRVVMHSRLVRTKQSAQVASLAMNGDNKIHLVSLSSLRSIDYGPNAGGREASEMRAGMAKVYDAWTDGYIDTRPDGGGDSCREVLKRAASALRTLVRVADTNGGSVMAISHSTYLRMLLAIVLEMPLGEAATLVQKNGCVNVIDFSRKEAFLRIGSNSHMFYKTAPPDFKLHVPKGNVIRINETRHLNDICRFVPS
jgi:broad specificity phosphatase PhoE